MSERSRISPDRDTGLVPFLAAMCLFLSAVEYAIPKPLPFMRIGFANLPVLFALYRLRPRDIALLVVLKIAGQGIVSGTLFSYVCIFSAAGSFAGALCMFAAHRLCGKRISGIGISLAGALGNNCAQLAVARIMLFGESTRYIAPLLLLTGLASGLLLGILARRFMEKSVWFVTVMQSDTADSAGTILAGLSAGAASFGAQRTAFRWFIVALLLFPVFLFQKRIVVLAFCLVVFAVLVRIKRGKVKILPSVILIAGIALCNLITPYGKVLCRIGSFPVTAGALISGLHRGMVLSGMVFLSQLAVDPALHIPGKAGRFLQQMFTGFDLFSEKKIPLKRRTFIAAVDRRLLEVWDIFRQV